MIRPPPRSPHQRHRGQRAEERAARDRPRDAAPRASVNVVEGDPLVDRRHVHEDVEPAERAIDLRERGVDRRLIGDVDLKDERPPAEAGDLTRARVDLAPMTMITECDVGAGPGQRECRDRANAAGAGDERGGRGQLHVSDCESGRGRRCATRATARAGRRATIRRRRR